jgi:hypothetical protein
MSGLRRGNRCLKEMAAAEPTNGWTLETLKAHFDEVLEMREQSFSQRLDDQQKSFEDSLAAAERALQAAMAAADRAVTKAEMAAEKRLENVNEWRTTFGDLTSKYMPRADVERGFEMLRDRIDRSIDGPGGLATRLERHLSQSSGKEQAEEKGQAYKQWAIGAVVAAMVGMLGAAISIASLLMRGRP